jgi:hypothetical protein
MRNQELSGYEQRERMLDQIAENMYNRGKEFYDDASNLGEHRSEAVRNYKARRF